MKKRKLILELLCTAVMAFAAGCGAAGSETADGGKEGAGSLFEDIGDGSIDGDTVQLKYGSKLFITDEQGNLLHEYDLEEINERFSSKGMALDSGNFKFYSDGALYYCCDVYDDGDEGNHSVIYAVDPEKDKAEVVYQTQNGIMAYYLDEYEDKLYFETYGQGDDNFTGRCFEKKDDLSFEEKGFDYNSFLDNDNGFIIKQELNKSYTSVSVPKILGEVGFVVAEKDNDLYRMTEGAEPELIYDAEDGYSPYVYFYDKNKVIFSLTDENYNDSQKYALDIDSGKADLIIDDKKAVPTDFDDGIVYYYISEESKFQNVSMKLYAYDTKTASSKLIRQEDHKPGANGIYDVFTNNWVSGSKLFSLTYEDGAYVWCVTDAKEDPAQTKSLGLVAQSFSAFDYGTVEAVNSEYACLDCGTPLSKYYGEKFVLDGRYSEHADEINKELADYIDGSANIAQNDSTFADSSCQEHQEDPEMYCVTDEDRVEDVYIIEDKYLAVNLSGYWYGGGAHGMPSKGQFLFDLTTGQRLGIKDFYKGTEEEFKDLIASKVKEDYEKEGKDYYYFAESADEAYTQAYESTALDDRAVFTEDGLDFLFYPYDIGPYASGFITMHVPYEELLGRSTLSE
jgi:predicted  nucleic acid-binding Zn-ribbon protein